MKMKTSKSLVGAAGRAFTIIELLVVIAIIVLLTGIILTNLTSSRSKARDAQRISDLGQIQLALEIYYDRCRQYPSTISGDISSVYNGCELDQSNNPLSRLSDFISKIPTPPSPTSQYDYAVSSSKGDYALHVTLENNNDLQKNSLQGTHQGSFTCYDGSNKEYCLGPK